MLKHTSSVFLKVSLYNICIAIFSCTVIPIIQIYAKFDWKFSLVLHKLISFCMFQNSYPSSHEQYIWCQMRLKLCFQHKPNIYRSSTWTGFILCSIDNKEPVFSLAFSKNSFFTESQGSLFKRIKFKCIRFKKWSYYFASHGLSIFFQNEDNFQLMWDKRTFHEISGCRNSHIALKILLSFNCEKDWFCTKHFAKGSCWAVWHIRLCSFIHINRHASFYIHHIYLE